MPPLFQFTKKVSLAIKSLNKSSSLSLQIISFKLNCLLARKLYLDHRYDESRRRYEDAWNSYEPLNAQIANYSLKMEFQQFYVNALFQLSNVYYKLNMPTKSFRFCEQTTVMISEILVNRIALTQEAYFQELAFKTEIDSAATRRMNSPVSPIQMEIALLMNDKKVAKSIRKKLPSSKEGTPAKASKRSTKSAKTPGKTLKIKSPDVFPIPSLPVVVAVDENSSLLGNNVAKQEENQRRSTVTRKIPVRTTTSSKVSAKEGSLKTATSGIVMSKKKASSAVSTSEQSAAAETVGGNSTRKTSRRLI